jgi:hypothetical protein
MDFVEQIAAQHRVPPNNLVVQYLIRKTKAADRGSKARRSLGNLYALLVLAEDYLANRTSSFTELMRRMKALPFGSKLQNHPLDNRLNDEFGRQLNVDRQLLPVQAITVSGQKGRCISEPLLGHGGANTRAVAQVIVDTIVAYVNKISANQTSILEEIDGIETLEDLQEFFDTSFAYNSDARLFEIASYALLAEYFSGQVVFMGESQNSVRAHPLRLFRTGRTNANDGGIDFVLQPLGKFFQVTETLDFRKYFLDFEKVNRYPMSFVIKIDGSREDVMKKIYSDAVRSQLYSNDLLNSYMSLFDQVYTLTQLNALVEQMPESSVAQIKATLSLQFQLEYGLLN